MTMHELLDMRLQHLYSDVDPEQNKGPAQCGTRTDWLGYTEWVSAEAPRVSIGWDWRLQCAWEGFSFMQDGAARTNLMLVDARDNDLGWATNLKVLSTVVQSVDWMEQVKRALEQRYGIEQQRREDNQ